ncbi:hypothetical protein SynSYN20_00706 [Synechococcus sp. SYN20]|nr:hypothetical protein SynSYN20_00706 [Synechococcus sp. SYN20]
MCVAASHSILLLEAWPQPDKPLIAEFLNTVYLGRINSLRFY